MKPATLIATIALALVALIHLARLIVGFQVTVDGNVVPVWASLPAFLATGGLAVAVWFEHRQLPK